MLLPRHPFVLPTLPPDQPGKSETYLEAIRKNIEWLRKHNKEESKDGEMWELLWEMCEKRTELCASVWIHSLPGLSEAL